MFNTLAYIGEQLNQANIVWGVGASILLNQQGLVAKPHDIDLLVAIQDIEKADEILKKMGEKKKREKEATYSTQYFYEYVIHGIEVDVMGGFAINHSQGTYQYLFDEQSVTKVCNINRVAIPFTSLEDWYVLYQLMPHREVKVNLIEEYLMSNGIKNTYLLNRALQGNLPEEVRMKVQALLSQQ